ncbi:hypothetical protein ASPWEDRAFT_438512 [Aspergillus wentii DTO 134E9]|uniref:Uncharacterized protein n=1 Tax=Aspergillus wentii DTO 134E9 TaxID=1073089 RepID=A0A1L9RQH5_ASPWE|nr:uncharacterized protein ASPWEDRAFT_438512 [Aspergillus wentii DTO 134E9]OJJ37067.1 hypothetical protein ASPWEDRAFT_438512 [Aspergillus wentii DTO 134E9]
MQIASQSIPGLWLKLAIICELSSPKKWLKVRTNGDQCARANCPLMVAFFFFFFCALNRLPVVLRAAEEEISNGWFCWQ